MLRLLASLFLMASTYAYQQDLSKVPNGNMYGITLGHPGGATKKATGFANSFYSSGQKWTKAFCQADADGDGQSNGFEMGDPCCVWSVGKTPMITVSLSDPNSASSKTTRMMPNCVQSYHMKQQMLQCPVCVQSLQLELAKPSDNAVDFTLLSVKSCKTATQDDQQQVLCVKTLIKNADQLFNDQKNGVSPTQSCTNLGLTCVQPLPPTQAPVPTTNAPLPTTTKAPVPTTKAPVPTTKAPVPTTKAPVPTTKAPMPTTNAPVPTTQAPVPTPPLPPIIVYGSLSGVCQCQCDNFQTQIAVSQCGCNCRTLFAQCSNAKNVNSNCNIGQSKTDTALPGPGVCACGKARYDVASCDSDECYKMCDLRNTGHGVCTTKKMNGEMITTIVSPPVETTPSETPISGNGMTIMISVISTLVAVSILWGVSRLCNPTNKKEPVLDMLDPIDQSFSELPDVEYTNMK